MKPHLSREDDDSNEACDAPRAAKFFSEENRASLTRPRFRKRDIIELDLKLKLVEGDPAGEKGFQCNVFRWPKDGGECDPLNMVQLPNGSWTGDCLRYHDDGYKFTEEMPRNCSLAEFDTYIREFSERLSLSVERLDNTTVIVFKAIVDRLRDVVEKFLLQPIEEVLDGIGCKFMPDLVETTINSLCFQGLAGLRIIANMYLLASLFIVILAIDMYVLFRVGIDRVTLQAQKKAEGS